MNNDVTINGRKVHIIIREKSSHAGGGYSIESLVIAGIHDHLKIGMDVEISFPEEAIRGRVTSAWVDGRKNITNLRVYRTNRAA